MCCVAIERFSQRAVIHGIHSRPEGRTHAGSFVTRVRKHLGQVFRLFIAAKSKRNGSFTSFITVNEGDFGRMMALRGTDIVRVPLADATRELKTVPLERYTEAEVFFGS